MIKLFILIIIVTTLCSTNNFSKEKQSKKNNINKSKLLSKQSQQLLARTSQTLNENDFEKNSLMVLYDKGYSTTMDIMKNLSNKYKKRIMIVTIAPTKITSINSDSIKKNNETSNSLKNNKKIKTTNDLFYLEAPDADLLAISINKIGLLLEQAKQLASRIIQVLSKNDLIKNISMVHDTGCFSMVDAIKILPNKYKDRMIVVAITPTKIIPIDLNVVCINYTLKKNKNTKLLDYNFNSPTYKDYIENEMQYFFKKHKGKK